MVTAASLTKGHTSRERSIAWIAVAAAVLISFVAYRSQTAHGPKVDEVAAAPTMTPQQTVAQQQLALAWIEGQVADESGEWAGSPSGLDPMLDDEEFEDALDDLPSLTADPSAPDWLLAAVADAAATGN
jgi:hypothetical protein